MNGRGYGGAGAPLTTLAVASEGNPHLEEQLQLLLAAEADVNLRGEPSGALRIFEVACRLSGSLGRQQSSLERIFAEISTTAVGFAGLLGREHLVSLLVKARADVSIRNNRGHSVLELARKGSLELVTRL